ncbi:MAG TPA: SIS domain-containing protein [Phototrophicaceae bacterium]|jgi:glucosamine--fructose-6-phosphate aminotransferase (isomerizing)|nr:SIS domain-containing protein [Phototrophicaceae bacterium]
MTQYGEYTRQEILSQPEAWAEALEHIRAETDNLIRFYRNGQYEQVIFTGCGSTYYLSIAAAALFQEFGVAETRALPASEIWMYPRSAYAHNRRTLLIPVSRSGETTETLRAVESFLARKQGDVFTISCYGENPLASMGTANLVLSSGQENSIAQTRAFTVLYLAVTAVAALWSGQTHQLEAMQSLSQVGRRLLNRFSQVAQNIGEDTDLEQFYFLGSGARYGLAAELSLKMKEMSLSVSEPFHFFEFRHGPQSMVTDKTLIVGLVSDANRAAELQVLNEMRQRGALVLTIGEDSTDVVFESGISEDLRGALYLPIGQLMAFERAIKRNLNPDTPRHLAAVVRLDGQ